MEIIESIRADAAAVLTDGRAKLVIGYRSRDGRRMPVFLLDPKQADLLVYDAECKQNLATYLRKSELKRFRPVAIVARSAVIRSLIMLHAESQLQAEEIVILAVGDKEYHGVMNLAGAAALLKEKYATISPDAATLELVRKLIAMTPDERSKFWTEQFAKCTRCYACRAACPGCYCSRCIVEKNVPQWISTAAAGHGNYAWNIIRAFHLAGRCSECGACEAACPQGIPLMLLNIEVGQDVLEQFGAKSGYDPDQKPVIGSWSPDDKEDFIR
jgi:formate dehydrogenase (coenzyme F420) beta subunit